MKNKILMPMAVVLAILATLTCSWTSTGSVTNGKESDATIRKTLKLEKFAAVSAAMGTKVVFTAGAYPGQVEIATTKSAEKHVDVYVSKGCLYVSYKNVDQRIKGPTIVYVTAPTLSGLRLASGAVFTSKSTVKAPGEFKMDLASGSSATIQALTCNKLDAEISSGATVIVDTLNGVIDYEGSSGSSGRFGSIAGKDAEIETSSGAIFKASAIHVTEKLEVEASSGSSAHIQGVKAVTVDAEASGAASVSIAGTAVSLLKKTSSVGTVDSSGLKVSGNVAEYHEGPKASKKRKATDRTKKKSELSKLPQIKRSKKLSKQLDSARKKLDTSKRNDSTDRDRNGFRIP